MDQSNSDVKNVMLVSSQVIWSAGNLEFVVGFGVLSSSTLLLTVPAWPETWHLIMCRLSETKLLAMRKKVTDDTEKCFVFFAGSISL